ncbi:hypothetical protein CFI11_03015 [Thalassococcus sp. S3]|nr:hypothetical protein CFI11_03015 [Thalassococcus sp. S3]
MHLSTISPLAHLFFRHWTAEDAEKGVVVAKARFEQSKEGLFYNEPEAPDLILSDIFVGDPATTPLVAEQDIAPAKTRTDVSLRATAHAPGGAALTDWPVGVSISSSDRAELLTWGLQVRGPTMWQRNRRGWKTQSPTPVDHVPLDYARVDGGKLVDAKGALSDFHAENPAGIGFATPATLNGVKEWRVPQIGELRELMIGGDPTVPLSDCGFGPIANTWAPRRALAGTFDDH